MQSGAKRPRSSIACADLDDVQNAVTLVDKRTLEVGHERAVLDQLRLEAVVDTCSKLRMRTGVRKHFCSRFAHCIPDVVVERTNLNAVVIDELGKELTVFSNSFFV